MHSPCECVVKCKRRFQTTIKRDIPFRLSAGSWRLGAIFESRFTPYEILPHSALYVVNLLFSKYRGQALTIDNSFNTLIFKAKNEFCNLYD